MPITRPPTMSEKDLDELLQRLANSGAKLQMLDPRVTQAQTWLLSVIGVAITGFIGWNIKTNQDMAQNQQVFNTRYEFLIKQSDRIESRVDRVLEKTDRNAEKIESVTGKADRLERHAESIDNRLTVIERGARGGGR